MTLTAPFPWFGGKRRVGPMVWERFGQPRGYIEPFFGSGAVLLGRPHPPGIETACEIDPYVANFWRAVKLAPDEVAEWADWPVNEADLHARHRWLVRNAAFRELMENEPEYFDAKVAGWWAWGISMWIGGEWCSRRWWVGDEGGEASTWRRRPSAGRGKGVHRNLPKLSGNGNAGVHGSPDRRRPARGISQPSSLAHWMRALHDRLRRVRFVCGDWKRVVTKPVRTCDGITAIFLDPPYSRHSGRSMRAIYGSDDFSIAADVATWAARHGEEKNLRIALCGFEGEHDMPESWEAVPWSRPPGYGNTGDGLGAAHAKREIIWFSPHCLSARQRTIAEVV